MADEGAAEPCGSVGQRETDQVHILVEVIAVAESVGSRRGSALREDDDEAREGDGQHHHYVAITDVRKTQMRKPAGHVPNNCNAIFSPTEIGARSCEPTNRKQSPGKLWGEMVQSDDDDQDGYCNEQTG